MKVTIAIPNVLVGDRICAVGDLVDVPHDLAERLASEGAVDGGAIEGFDPCHRPYGPAEGPTMRVELMRSTPIPDGRTLGPGDVIEAPEALAREMVSHGEARPTRRVQLIAKGA